MKNVTVTLDEEIARWARVEAAKAGKSLSRWISDRLSREKDASTPNATRVATLERFIAGPGWPGIAQRLPTRDEIHDRPSLRRYEH